MRGLEKNAMSDFNQNIQTIKDNAIKYSQDVIVSVVNCGAGHTAHVAREVVNSSVTSLKPMSFYEANGRGTPLYDSVGELIKICESVPDYNDPNVSFLITVITDGEENCSQIWTARSLANKIATLQATDRWTFVFRVPRGYARNVVRDLNLREGNVQEWDQTTKGYETSTAQTSAAFDEYFTARSTGVRSTSSFYTSLKDVSITDIKSHLTDISKEVVSWQVQTSAEGNTIREFVEHKLGDKMKKGAAFYQLMKVEPKIGDAKLIIIKDKTSGVVYSGDDARDMIGLPKYGPARVHPGDHGNFEIYVQSTSVNRKLNPGTTVLYWGNVGIAYKQGKSA
jgi:hypothetical protein